MINKFSLSRRISDVWSFLVNPEANSKIYFVSPEHKLWAIDEQFTKLNLWETGLFQSLNRVGEDVWGFEYTQLQTVAFSQGRPQGQALPYVVIPVEGKRNNVNCLCLYRSKTERGYVLLDITSKTFIKQYPLDYGLNGIHQVVDDERFLSRKDNLLTYHAFADGEELWRVDFKDLLGTSNPSLYGQLIPFDNKLFFYLNDSTINPSQRAIFCLDITTGKLLRQWEGLGGYLKQLGSTLYYAYWQEFFQLDMITLEGSRIDLSAISAPYEFRINTSRFILSEDNLLYFVDRPVMPSNRIGIIDLNTFQFVWQTSIEVNDGVSNAISEIQLHGNHLYALTSDHTLHIFERETT